MPSDAPRAPTPRFDKDHEETPTWASSQTAKRRPTSAMPPSRGKSSEMHAAVTKRPCSARPSDSRWASLPGIGRDQLYRGTQHGDGVHFNVTEPDEANGRQKKFFQDQGPSAKQAWQPNPDVRSAGQRMASRKKKGGWTGDLPLHLDQWFESKDIPRMGGLRLVPTKPQDTLGPAAKKPPKDYREPSKRTSGPTMIRPGASDTQKGGGLRMVPQRNRWADEEKPAGSRKFHAREAEVIESKGLRIIRDENGEMFKEKRSQVMSFTDLTGTKRTFNQIEKVPGFKNPTMEDPNAWPGMKGRDPDVVNGKYVDYTLRENGGFLSGKKMINDTFVIGGRGSDPLGASTATNRDPPRGGGAPTVGEGAPSHGIRGKTRHQGISALLAAWGD